MFLMVLLLELILLGLEVESIFFFWGIMLGRCVWAEFFVCPFLLSLLFRLWIVSIKVSMEESFAGVFCLLVFLVRMVSLGAGDAGSSGLLGFFE